MADRADFVKKIKDELRKAEPEQNRKLLAFWQAELDKIPVQLMSAGSGNVIIACNHPLIHSHYLFWLFLSLISCDESFCRGVLQVLGLLELVRQVCYLWCHSLLSV
jgi:hypothetical protein